MTGNTSLAFKSKDRISFHELVNNNGGKILPQKEENKNESLDPDICIELFLERDIRDRAFFVLLLSSHI